MTYPFASPSLEGANASSVRRRNRSVLFLAIRNRGPISRSELAELTGLNAATAGRVVEELIAAGLVRETGFGESSGGRRPIRLEVDSPARNVVAVDLQRFGVTAALTDLDAKILLQTSADIPRRRSEDAIAAVLDTIQQILGRCDEQQRQRIMGIGIASPGPVTYRTGTVRGTPDRTIFSNVALAEIVSHRFGIPTFVDAKEKCCALAELWFGAGRRFTDFVFVGVGTGIGAGLVLNGDLYRGSSDLAGEIGHACIEPHGLTCWCGNTGCLETVASLPSLMARVRPALEEGRNPLLREAVRRHGGELSLEAILEAVDLGEPVSRRSLDEVAWYLGLAIVNLVNTFDPQAVIVGRQMALAGSRILDPIRTLVAERSIEPLRDTVQILPADLIMNGTMIGAVALVLQEIFNLALLPPAGAGEPNEWLLPVRPRGLVPGR